MPLGRRDFCVGAGAILASTAPISCLAAQNQGDRLVLLGTRGGPLLDAKGPTPSANVIVHAGIPYVIDTGYGVSMKLLQAGVRLADLRNIFITHHHSDHNLELGPLLHNSWLSGLRSNVDVYGPRGVSALLSAYWQSAILDIETRIGDEGRPDPRGLVTAHEFGEGPVVKAAGVQVSALRNHHPPVAESFAVKFEFPGRKVVFSGDTAFLPSLAEFARNADYLVHEVFYPAALPAMLANRPNAPRLGASIASHHTAAQDVGRIATDANVKALVLTHYVPADAHLVTPLMWLDAVRTTFKGRIILGRDMMSLKL